MSLRLDAYGEFDCDFNLDSQEWSCSKTHTDTFLSGRLLTQVRTRVPETLTDAVLDREFDFDSDEWVARMYNHTTYIHIYRHFGSHEWSCSYARTAAM